MVGIFAITLKFSVLLISLPAIFAGLELDPLAPGNISLLRALADGKHAAG